MVLRICEPEAVMLDRRGTTFPGMPRFRKHSSSVRFGVVSMVRRGKAPDDQPARTESWRPLFTARSMISMMMGRASLDLPFVFPRDDE